MIRVLFSRLALMVAAISGLVHGPICAQTEAQEPGTSPVVLLRVTDQTIADTPFYLNRPEQGDAPDGVFKTGTKVQRLSRIPSFVRVRSETGIEAFVATEALAPSGGRPASLLVFEFSADKVAQVRSQAREALTHQAEPREETNKDRTHAGTERDDAHGTGWTANSMDLTTIVGAFKPLRIKRGYVLRGYLFRWGQNARGIVWALPADAKFPRPRTSGQENGLAKPPRPPGALDHVMDAVEGDQTPSSYVCASMLFRELHESGAVWHGISWGHHVVLGANPLTSGFPRIPNPPGSIASVHLGGPRSGEWTWSEAEPKDWQPQVRIEDQRVIVTFYTYSGYGGYAIYRHVDSYQPGSYRFESSVTQIADGPLGYIY